MTSPPGADNSASPDPLGEVGIDLRAGHRVGAQRDGVIAAPLGLDAEIDEQLDHRLDVPDPRHVVQQQLLVGKEAGRQQRQCGVLVAGGRDRAAERHAALDDELLHEGCLGGFGRERARGGSSSRKRRRSGARIRRQRLG
jgi:hypothetical protein